MADAITAIPNDGNSRRNHESIPDRGDDWVVSGFRLIADWDTGTLKVARGEVAIVDSGTLYWVRGQPRTGLSLPSSGSQDVNYVIDTAGGLSGSISLGGSPSQPTLPIGSVDADAQTTTQLNREPDETFGVVSTGTRAELAAYAQDNLPTSPPAGTFVRDNSRGLPAWWDNDHWEWPNFVDDVKVSATTVANTTTRTSVFNPGINAGSLIQGRIYQIDIHGTFETANTSDQFTVDIDLAGTDVAGVTNAPANVGAGTPWTLELTFTVRSHGSSGTVKANTRATFNEQPRTADHGEITVDTTTQNQLEVFITWGAADASNSVTVEQAHLKQMG